MNPTAGEAVINHVSMDFVCFSLSPSDGERAGVRGLFVFGSWGAPFRDCACIGTMNPKCISGWKSTNAFSGSWRGFRRSDKVFHVNESLMPSLDDGIDFINCAAKPNGAMVWAYQL